MPLNVNGTNIEKVNVNGQPVKKVVCNGSVVWQEIPCISGQIEYWTSQDSQNYFFAAIKIVNVKWSKNFPNDKNISVTLSYTDLANSLVSLTLKGDNASPVSESIGHFLVNGYIWPFPPAPRVINIDFSLNGKVFYTFNKEVSFDYNVAKVEFTDIPVPISN